MNDSFALIEGHGLNNRAQMMVPEYTSDKRHTWYYLCIRRCKGCHNYREDCRYDSKPPTWCRSYGKSALKINGNDRAYRTTDYFAEWCDWDNGCTYIALEQCFCTKENEENGCNYDYPLTDRVYAKWHKFKIIWNQHNEAVNAKKPDIASVAW